jgi:hypothetical protein
MRLDCSVNPWFPARRFDSGRTYSSTCKEEPPWPRSYIWEHLHWRTKVEAQPSTRAKLGRPCSRRPDEQARLGNKALFSFELSWLRREGFFLNWFKGNGIWLVLILIQWKLSLWLGQKSQLCLYDWKSSSHEPHRYSRHKVKTSPLNEEDCRTLPKANNDLTRRDEETKSTQCAKVKNVQEGGNNTQYFHLIANEK